MATPGALRVEPLRAEFARKSVRHVGSPALVAPPQLLTEERLAAVVALRPPAQLDVGVDVPDEAAALPEPLAARRTPTISC